MSRRFRAATTAAVTVAATASAVFVASPAQASPSDCLSYLAGAGYPETTAKRMACERAASGEIGGYVFCYDVLRETGVSPAHAAEACDRADGVWAASTGAGPADR
ncbi:hypothetical protein ABZ860_39110 [Microbispora sp. NPDC046973]|uniref:hypothetical protein n=1 Tax=Microbispora sp. NPDC046973 TaxID=3155022 RepID=UPI0034008B24